MKKGFFSAKRLCRSGVVAALYVVFTVSFGSLSFLGGMQVRPSEGLCMLPLLYPEAVAALCVGCFLSNLFSPFAIFDITVGVGATLLAALCTRRLRGKFWLAAAMPVVFNGVIVGAVVHYCYSPAFPLPLCMLTVAIGEAIACMIVGPLLIGALRRIPGRVFE